jgi:hypothetical protein
MKYITIILALGFLSGCGDKSEDTGSDTGDTQVVDTGSAESE